MRARKSKYIVKVDLSTIRIPFLEDATERKSGIYCIYNLTNDKIYIGSAYDFVNRRISHFSGLSRKQHENDYLQNAFNLLDITKFAMVVLEYCEISKLTEREQYYLDLYKAYERNIGYNISKIAGKAMQEGAHFKVFSPDGKLVEGRNLRAFCRENDISLEAFKHYSSKTRGILAGGWRIFIPGVHPDRDLTLEEMRHLKRLDYERAYSHQCSEYRFLVNGKEVIIQNLMDYAIKNGLDRGILHDTYNRNVRPYAGHISLKSKEMTQKQLNWKGNKFHFLISKNGELLKVDNLRQFCREKSIDRNMIKRFSKTDRFYKDYLILKANIYEKEFNKEEIEYLYTEKLKLLQKDCN